MNNKTSQDEIKKQTRVAFYIRVSTEEQVKGFGLDMQREALEKMMVYKGSHNDWIHKKEWEFVDEGCSGGDLNRAEFQLMMQYVKEHKIDVVAVYKIDRVSRNLSHLLKVFEDLQNNKVSFYSIKEDIDFSGPIGRLTFQIFGALAEFERELIKSRTIEGKITSARQGNYIGNGIPFGYKKVENVGSKGKKLEIIESEAKWVRTIFDWFIYERKSYEEIARELNRLKIGKGISGKKENKFTKWYGVTIRDMIRNTTYMGIRVERIKNEKEVEEIIIKTPAIINEVKFLEATSRFGQIEETKGKKGGGKNVYLLSRKIIDKETNRNFIGVSRKKGGFSYRRKNFIDVNGIKHKNLEIPVKEIDEIVWDSVITAINRPEEFYKIYQKQNIEDRELQRKIDLKDKLAEDIEKIKTAKLAVEDDFYSGSTTSENRGIHCQRYNKEIDAKYSEISKLDNEINKILEAKTAQDALNNFSSAFKNKLNKLDLEAKQRLIDLMIYKIEYEETEEYRDINIIFRFAHRLENKNEYKGEPKSSKGKQKNTQNISNLSVIGRGDRT